MSARPRLCAAVLAALLLSACGGEESASSGTTDYGDYGDSGVDRAATECVGKSSGKITLDADSETDLPGGSTARLGSIDLDSDPPVASVELGEATRIERRNARELSIGDRFGVQRGVYKVVGICADSATLTPF